MSVQLPTDYYIKQRKGTDLMLDRYTDKFMYIKLKPSVGKHWPVSLSMDVPFSLWKILQIQSRMQRLNFFIASDITLNCSDINSPSSNRDNLASRWRWQHTMYSWILSDSNLWVLDAYLVCDREGIPSHLKGGEQEGGMSYTL